MAGKAKRNGGGEITMSDIARHAGVSPMTVSRALSDPSSVSEKMRRKVDAAVRQFGYLPNRIAGSLSSKRSNVVGLVGVVALFAAASLDPRLYYDINVDQKKAGVYQNDLAELYDQLGIGKESGDRMHQVGPDVHIYPCAS